MVVKKKIKSLLKKELLKYINIFDAQLLTKNNNKIGRSKKYARLTENRKSKTVINSKTIEELELELSKYGSKTVDYDKFMKYIKIKLQTRNLVSLSNLDKLTHLYQELDNMRKKLDVNDKDNVNKFVQKNIEVEKYKQECGQGTEYNKFLRKLRLYAYINKQRHEAELLNELEKLYGSDAVFLFGDWSDRGRLRRISRLVSRRFKVFLTDEYRTSQLYHKTGQIYFANKMSGIGQSLKINTHNTFWCSL